MPYADNQGVRIRYEVEGRGPPLVLHHGFGGFLEMWSDLGYVEALKDDYRLLLIDGRGCGRSDKPHNREAYRLAARVADVVAILDALGIDRAHFLGYSMDGYPGWGVAAYAHERFLSLMLGGGGVRKETWDEADHGLHPIQTLARQGPEAWAAAMETMFGRWWQPQWRARYLAADVVALDLMASRWEGISYARALPRATLPCLVFGGEEDGGLADAQRASGFLPNATFVSLPGLSHVDAFCRTDLVLPLVRDFLARVG